MMSINQGASVDKTSNGSIGKAEPDLCSQANCKDVIVEEGAMPPPQTMLHFHISHFHICRCDISQWVSE